MPMAFFGAADAVGTSFAFGEVMQDPKLSARAVQTFDICETKAHSEKRPWHFSECV